MPVIGNEWDKLLAEEWDKPYYQELRQFLREEYNSGPVYPPAGDIFNALKFTPYDRVKVVILGQDPYHEPGQAQGLSFSVPYDVQRPPSLVNIIKELEADRDAFRNAAGSEGAEVYSAGANAERERGADGYTAEDRSDAERYSAGEDGISGVLVPWARHGVLLLNTVLTVKAHQAGSHRGRGWEKFTDRVIELLSERETPMVFILWGSNAGAKKDLILRAQGERRRHLIIQAPHPSPLSAYRGFFGGRYFSRCNYFLEDNGIEPVDWRL